MKRQALGQGDDKKVVIKERRPQSGVVRMSAAQKLRSKDQKSQQRVVNGMTAT